MNQQLWSGLTAALIIASLGTASSSYADQPPGDQLTTTDESLEADVSVNEPQPQQTASGLAPSEPSEPVNPVEAASSDSSLEAVKVGEHQSQAEVDTVEETVASIHPHEMDGRQAATLYVRGIPVLTFLGSDAAEQPAQSSSSTGSEVKVAATQSSDSAESSANQATEASANADSDDYTSDPVWRATSVAARLNQMHRDSVNAEDITVSWDADQERYLIKVNDEELVEINPETLLPGSTNDLAEDALQVTNRLRRQMGDAPPLREVAGRPRPAPQEASVGPIQFSMRGMASWYGPGFHGNRSASGEVFNQNALTAAHRNLPFGTQVRVTNLNNGQSVVVRINDRGPYSGGRVIDLSAAAARAVGLIQAGVAPVSVDVLGVAQTAASQN
ncbi:septal ring lytic transglycosylase RlpA family protein [Leptolyngbya sp. FACHB-541]|uniref:septal ring lytic transglycosylase RlpA family protein n=1 Tax=Leptolyngbya sp. FACHB-541 TaxID=2692810 RepID=UPI0016868879|nr:septal ring lytic transglycosylase RlpA family protein [Leptolyngbya sp. FACHB-541]MBD2000761.1 septal ring lytic transglycosylase RlpA family protein [Leptolyngbya sp. FACHB-541]